MQPITHNLLINFDGQQSREELEYEQQVWGSIELKFSQISKYGEVDRFTVCSECKMLLTVEDRELVLDCDDIQGEEHKFTKDQIARLEMDKINNLVWVCRFCCKNNILNRNDIKFAQNKSRVVHKPAVKGAKAQPIILIVFDTSGSMEEQIFESNNKKKDPKLQAIINKIKETKIYQKIVKEQQKAIDQFVKKQKTIEKQFNLTKQYEDHLKKNKLLMSITELAIEKNSSKTNVLDKKTIGFIFFNSFVYLHLKGQKNIKTIYDQQDYCKSENKEKTNFHHFESLFKLGQKYGSEFSTPVSQFKFKNLDLEVNNPQGQTALGPAIAIALGIVTKHGPGSTIIVVTDGIANKGLFQQTQNWDKQYKLMKIKLQKYRASLVVLQWRNLDSKNEKQKKQKEKNPTGMNLDSFCKANKSSNGGSGITQKIVILFNQSSSQNQIQQIQKKVDACINRNSNIWTDELLLQCENPNIDYSKSLKRIGNNISKLSHYVEPAINEAKLQSQDYLFPFMTQIVVRYKDNKGQQATFMSYIMQKLVKYSNLKKKDKKLFDNENTLKSVAAYLQAQDLQYSLQNLSLSLVKKTFRNTIFNKTVRYKTQDLQLQSQKQPQCENPKEQQDISKLRQKQQPFDTNSSQNIFEQYDQGEEVLKL